MPSEIIIRQPEYLLTVRDAFLAFIASRNSDLTPVWENNGTPGTNKIHQLPLIKKIGVAPEVSSKKIYASGMTYDVTQRTKGAQITNDMVVIPRDIVDKALGTTLPTSSMAYSKTNDKGSEFAFGYYMEESKGGLVYYLHPRCQMIEGQAEFADPGDSDADPQITKAIEVLPTHEGVWRIRYATADVAEGKVPLTMVEFFGAMPYTIAQISALAATEQAAG